MSNQEFIIYCILAVLLLILIIIGIIILIKLRKPKRKLIKGAEKNQITEDVEKKYLKTILLHMTDGIIAFNMEGRIILINPAATRQLRILPEDENFEKIFQKYDVDINMEKQIYLENWTSTICII